MNEIQTTNVLRLLEASTEIKARLSGEFASVHGLSVNEFLLLLHLQRATAHRLSRVELSKRMHVSASTVTRMARPMEKVGLLGREADARDARLAFVVLTETGATRLAEAQATLAKRAEGFFADRWTDEELTQLSGLLGRLIGGPSRLT